MRTRSKSTSYSPTTINWLVTNRFTGAFLAYVPEQVGYAGSFVSSKIIDDPSPVSTYPLPWKACTHTKVEATSKGGGGPVGAKYFFTGDQKWEFMGAGNAIAAAPPLASFTYGSIPSGSTLNTKILSQLSGAMPKDTVVNLGELISDFSVKGLYNSFTHILKTGNDILGSAGFGSLTRSIRNRKDLIHRTTLKNVSDDYLAVTLSLLPLYSDVQKLIHLADNINRQIAQLSWRNNVERFKLKAQEVSAGKVYESLTNRTIQYENIKSATLEVTAKYADNDLQRKILLMSSFRLDTPLSTLWELAPLSFVIDYFVSVQSRLEAFENAQELRMQNLLPGTLSLHRYVTTLASRCSRNETVFFRSLMYTGPIYKYTTYQRSPIVDPYTIFTEPSLQTVGLTLKHSATLGALVVSRSLR